MGIRFKEKTGSIILGAACIAAPLAVGIVSAALTGDQMKIFGEMRQPPLSPPTWMFPAAWTILYILMGISILLILKSDYRHKAAVTALFVFQLILNFLWSPVFFLEKEYVIAVVILILMLAATIILTAVTWRFSKAAAVMLMPYIAWMSFATYLNMGIIMLN